MPILAGGRSILVMPDGRFMIGNRTMRFMVEKVPEG